MKKFDMGKIREFRLAAKLTQDELAVKMSLLGKRVYIQQISEWENSPKSGLTTTHLAKLCEALEKTTDDFFVEQ